MKYGYARVSTDDQKTDLQIAALKKADCEYRKKALQPAPRLSRPFWHGTKWLILCRGS